MKQILSFLYRDYLKEIIPLLLAITIIIILLKYKYKHRFWDFQPVMRTKSPINGIIGIRPNFNIISNSSHKILINKTPVEEIIPFLKDNFADNYNIDDNYLKYIYNKPEAINVCLMNNNEIIGFIHSSPLKLNYNNKNIKFQYADFLCVKKKYRNDSIASIIIASFLKNMKSNKQPVLFKKDFSKLPFLPILDTYYYVKDLTKLKPEQYSDNITELSVYNFYEVYHYINTLLRRYKFHKTYSKQELVELFLEKKILKMYIINNISNMKTLIIGKKNIYNVFNKIYNCFEIDYIIGELRYSNDVYKTIANYLKREGYNYISIPKIGSNAIFIEENNFIRGLKLYYYTYNYTISDLRLNDFCFNIN